MKCEVIIQTLLYMTHIKQINKEIRDLENNTLNDSTVSEYQIENHEALSF